MFKKFFLTAFLMAAASTMASAGAVGGSKIDRNTLRGGHTMSYDPIYFVAGYTGEVTINGDGSTYLDLYVYDQNDNLISHDAGVRPSVTFTPKWTGAFYIKVYNRGTVYNDYVLRTN